MEGEEEETEEATAACNCLSSGETPPLLFTLFASLCFYVPLYFYIFYARMFFFCIIFLGAMSDAASFSFGLFGSSLPPSICSTPPSYIFCVLFTSFLLFCTGAEGAKAPLLPSKRISGEL